jgi:hypothetical protein
MANQKDPITVRVETNLFEQELRYRFQKNAFEGRILLFCLKWGTVIALILGFVCYHYGLLDADSATWQKINAWSQQQEAEKHEAVYGHSKTVEQLNNEQQQAMLCRNHSPYCENNGE